ncbi:MAG: S24/S26 family peptidase [Bacteroidales bacterium]|nr:S24/S26 family peptidase [Bacteroidales bacterium]
MPTFNFEDILERDGQLVYTNTGNSMMPLLREHRDILIINRKTDKRLRILDCPLFKRDDGKYVLHRVMWVRKKDYVICGDNQWYLERGISDKHIIGVLTAVIRDGKRLEMNSFKMRLYSVLQWLFYPMRALWLFFFQCILPKLKRKIFH